MTFPVRKTNSNLYYKYIYMLRNLFYYRKVFFCKSGNYNLRSTGKSEISKMKNKEAPCSLQYTSDVHQYSNNMYSYCSSGLLLLKLKSEFKANFYILKISKLINR